MQDRNDTPAAALWDAAYVGDGRAVEHLLAEGVDVNVWDSRGRGALTFAILVGHHGVVRQLTDAGAWIDPFEDYSLFMSPLMCAAECGHVEIVEFLLDRGADPTKRGGVSQCTAEYYARAPMKGSSSDEGVTSELSTARHTNRDPRKVCPVHSPPLPPHGKARGSGNWRLETTIPFYGPRET